jgi:hypothetical protein
VVGKKDFSGFKIERRNKMRKQKQFTEEQKLQLLKSPFIERVLSNHLEYSVEFKQMAVTQYLQGKTPVEIFVNANLDLELIGRKNAFNLIKKWLKEKEKFPKFKSLEDEVKELRARNQYLEEVLYATKKLYGLED